MTFNGAADSITVVLDTIRDLLKLIEGTDVVEIEARQGDLKVRIKKAGAFPTVSSSGVAAAASPPQPSPPPPGMAAPHTALELEPGQVLVTSPFVGTFYRAPAPNAKPFVEVGDAIRKGQAVCIVEAMKLMNEIEAEMDGEVVAILRENGATVEFGEPLMVLKRG